MMTHVHNSLFLQQNGAGRVTKKSIDELLPTLTHYMLSIDSKTVPQHLQIDTNIENNIETDDKSRDCVDLCQNNANVIAPHQEDSLFWCIYIAIHQYDEYLMINNKHRTCEIEWKQRLTEKMNACHSMLKQSNHKVTKTNIQEILSDLMTSPFKTNFLCVVAITVYHNIQFIIMN